MTDRRTESQQGVDLECIRARHDADEREGYQWGRWSDPDDECFGMNAHEDRGDLLDEVDRLRAGLTAICDADHDSADMRTIAKRVLEGLEP